jgi:hypothetical protein
MIEFEFWLYNIETQTLTDDLKKEILEMVEELFNSTYQEAYYDAKQKIVNYIENDI